MDTLKVEAPPASLICPVSLGCPPPCGWKMVEESSRKAGSKETLVKSPCAQTCTRLRNGVCDREEREGRCLLRAAREATRSCGGVLKGHRQSTGTARAAPTGMCRRGRRARPLCDVTAKKKKKCPVTSFTFFGEAALALFLRLIKPPARRNSRHLCNKRNALGRPPRARAPRHGLCPGLRSR